MVIKMVHIGNDWDQVLDGEFDKEYYRKLRNSLHMNIKQQPFIQICMISSMR